jgi:ribosome-binding protein aMBF1 (putative translation factor)
MPECHRCNRTFATADVRRTTKGHVCKDTVGCKRRLTLTRSPIVDSRIADRLILHTKSLNELADGHDPLAALRVVKVVNDDLVDFAHDVVMRAARETNLTQKQLAEALGVPPSALRGLKQAK